MSAFGQMGLKLAMVAVPHDSSVLGIIKSLIFNATFLVAFVLYALAFISWLYVLRILELNVAYPLLASTYLVVAVLSKLFLNETVSLFTLIGLAFITIGVMIVGIHSAN